MVIADVLGFRCNGLRVVVAHPGAADRIVEPRHLRCWFPMPNVAGVAQSRAGKNSPIAIALFPVAWPSIPLLEKARIHVRDVAIRVTIEWHSHEQLRRRDAGVEKGAHCDIDV